MLFIVIVFYTYTAFVGKSILAVDIITFASSIIISQLIGYEVMRRKEFSNKLTKIISWSIIGIFIILFTIFTFV